MEKKTIDKRYFHLSNSGVTVEVADEGHGPTVTLKASTFGNLNQNFSFHCDPECLVELGNMFTAAAQQQYSKEYVCSVKYLENKAYTSESGSDNT